MVDFGVILFYFIYFYWHKIILLCCDSQQFEKSRCLNERRVLKGAGRMTKNVIGLKNELDEKDLSHIMWWKEVLF